MLVALFSAFTLSGSAITTMTGNHSAFLLLQALFSISTGGCALFGLIMLANTIRSVREQLEKRRELEAINAEQHAGMEKMILKRTETLRKEITEKQNLTKKLLEHSENFESEMRVAGNLQRALMPENITFRNLKGAIQYHPKGIVSGDVYDRFNNENGDVYIFCGDAMGHGTAAALFTFLLSAAIRSADRYEPPSKILSNINKLLISRKSDLYATGVLARISTAGQLTICHAGHESVILLKASGEIAPPFKHSGFALGMFDDDISPYIDEEVELKTGDRVFFYTDGITESTNEAGAYFGLENLTGTLVNHQTDTIEHTAAAVIEALYDHIDNQPLRDDLTLLGIEFGQYDE